MYKNIKEWRSGLLKLRHLIALIGIAWLIITLIIAFVRAA